VIHYGSLFFCYDNLYWVISHENGISGDTTNDFGNNAEKEVFMLNIKEKVAYLQGMTAGMDIDTETREGMLLANVVDVLEDIAYTLDGMRMQQDDLECFVETIDEDLTDLEDDYYDIEVLDEDYDDLSDEGIDFVEVECPSCHEAVHFEEDFLHDDDGVEISCPNCGGIVYDSDLDLVDPMANARVDVRHPGL
jgi:ribosomal protein S27E